MDGKVTFRKMSNIYLTLVSDVTQNYASNVANQFKARWHTLAWNKDGVQLELVLTHSHMDNSIYIYKPLAETLHWINTKSNQADSMGPNLVHSYPNHTKGASSLETGKPTQILGNWLHLSTLSDWRFINLNQSFEDALNL